MRTLDCPVGSNRCKHAWQENWNVLCPNDRAMMMEWTAERIMDALAGRHFPLMKTTEKWLKERLPFVMLAEGVVEPKEIEA